jgi:hypothetical protein
MPAAVVAAKHQLGARPPPVIVLGTPRGATTLIGRNPGAFEFPQPKLFTTRRYSTTIDQSHNIKRTHPLLQADRHSLG